MKTPLKLKILLFLQAKIKAIPEGQKAPKWLIYSSVIMVWLVNLPKKIRRLYHRLIDLPLIALIRNFCFVFFTSKSIARIFTGYFYRWLAVRYAEKRSRISAVNKTCGGKRHYVVTYDTDSLIVINKVEMNRLRSKHFLKKNYNITDVLRDAYYVTKTA